MNGEEEPTKSRKKTGRLTVFPLTCNKLKEILVFRLKQETITRNINAEGLFHTDILKLIMNNLG